MQQSDPLIIGASHRMGVADYAPTTGYDPRLDGADCDHCPMRRWRAHEWAPVPAKLAARGAKGIFIGEAPGKDEVERGAPFVGESGKELNEALGAVGIKRSVWDVDNTIACRALLNREGKDDYKLIRIRLRREKRQKRQDGLPVSPAYEQHPADHCRKRLLRNLERHENVIALGGTAAGAVLGGAPSILGIRGGPAYAQVAVPVTVDGARTLDPRMTRPIKVLPTVHPAFVRRARRWRRVFQRDLERALRFFTDTLQWTDPLVLYQPTPEQLRAFFAKPSRVWTYDVETDSKYAMHANLRCLAIGRDATEAERALGFLDVVASVGFVSCEYGDDDLPRTDVAPFGSPGIYSPQDAAVIRAIIEGAFRDGRLWCGHNAGWYDRIVMEQRWGVAPRPLIDTIMLHRLAASELPHSLGVIGSIYTDVVSWKQDNEGTKLAFGARTDRELQSYCATDVAVTHRILPQIAAEVRQRGQDAPCPARPSVTLASVDHRLQDFCVGLTKTGLFIDPVEQQKQEHELQEAVTTGRAKVESMDPRAGAATFNPASPNQVRDVLYTRKGFSLDPVAYTDTGDASTGDSCLREHLMSATTPPEAVAFIRALRGFRSKHKLLTSFVIPCRRRSVDPEKGGVDDDGRLRVSWSAHVPVTGRLASSQPLNAQNWPKICRKMVIAAPGHKLVGADFDQLEGRIAAGRWGLTKYLEAFKTAGMDPHQITMEGALGSARIWSAAGAPPEHARFRKKWTNADGSTGSLGGAFNELRNLIKRYFYLKIYSGGDRTVWGMLREIEEDCTKCKGGGKDATGVLCRTCDGWGTIFAYAGLKESEVASMSRKFLQANPELEAGWAKEIGFYKKHGFNREPMSGRRRDFLDGFDPNEVINFPIQSGGAALMNFATLDVLDAGYTSDYAGPGTGPIQQGHDALVLEVPEREAPAARECLEHYMTQTYPHIAGDVVFTAEAEIGDCWKDV